MYVRQKLKTHLFQQSYSDTAISVQDITLLKLL